jgi:hypothetical protein
MVEKDDLIRVDLKPGNPGTTSLIQLPFTGAGCFVQNIKNPAIQQYPALKEGK